MTTYKRKISKRITTICDFLDNNKITYDLCCDHGLIGLEAHRTKNIPKVIFVDQIKHITEDLEKKLNQYCDKPYEVICSPCENIELPEANVNIVIAGVYAATIYQFIESAMTAGKHTLIMSPNSDHGLFIERLKNYNFNIVDQKTVIENHRRQLIVKALGPH